MRITTAGHGSAALDREVEAGQSWAEDLLAELVAVPSVAGTPTTIIGLLADVAADLPLDLEMLPGDPDRTVQHPEYSPAPGVTSPTPPVLCGRWQHGGDEELLLFAHTDTEPVHPGWDVDPFQLRLEGRRAIGLGVADDKAGVVSVLAALRAFSRVGVEPRRTPRLVLGAGKLGGSLGTLPGVVAARGVSAAVYCHPAESGRGLSHLKVASRGVLQLDLQVPGRTPEPVEVRTPASADPRSGHNPIDRAVRLAAALTQWSESTDHVVALTAILTPDPVPFQVPGAVYLTLACWFTTGTVDDVRHDVAVVVRGLDGDDWEREHPVTLKATGLRANPASCEGSPFADQVRSVVERRTDELTQAYAWHAASDIRFPMRCLGVPAVGLGATAGQFYGAQEWVDLPSMHRTTAALVDLLGVRG